MNGTLDRDRAADYPLHRRAVVAELLAERGDMLVVAGLGAPVWDCTAAGDHPLNFPLWGAMVGLRHGQAKAHGATRPAGFGDYR